MFLDKMSMFLFFKRSRIHFFLLPLLIFKLSLPVWAENLNLLMGNPSQATSDLENKNNFLMEKKFFTLSYNNSKGTPNWVSWRLVKEDLGNALRFPFYPDPDLPKRRFIRILPRDYNAGGFDRGHMCPHGDRSATNEMSKETFVMTNIVPQSPDLNRKIWNQLEIYCRSLARKGKTLYIIAGPAGQGGVGEKGPRNMIGRHHKVDVPSTCWKVMMVLDSENGDDIKQVNAKTRLIAVIIPNHMKVGQNWAKFRVSVKDVENLTGYTFFSQVPQEIIEPLKNKVDDHSISLPHLHPFIRHNKL